MWLEFRRVFFWSALASEGKIYGDENSIVAVGARFIPKRGYAIGFMSGDIEKCVNFALYKAKSEDAGKLIIMHRAKNDELHKELEDAGFTYLPSNLLMLEGDFC